jgi:hypothetical protein
MFHGRDWQMGGGIVYMIEMQVLCILREGEGRASLSRTTSHLREDAGVPQEENDEDGYERGSCVEEGSVVACPKSPGPWF